MIRGENILVKIRAILNDGGSPMRSELLEGVIYLAKMVEPPLFTPKEYLTIERWIAEAKRKETSLSDANVH